jgi:hypothetical protein
VIGEILRPGEAGTQNDNLFDVILSPPAPACRQAGQAGAAKDLSDSPLNFTY